MSDIVITMHQLIHKLYNTVKTARIGIRNAQQMWPILAVSDSQKIPWESDDMDEFDGLNRENRTGCPNLKYMKKSEFRPICPKLGENIAKSGHLGRISAFSFTAIYGWSGRFLHLKLWVSVTLSEFQSYTAYTPSRGVLVYSFAFGYLDRQ